MNRREFLRSTGLLLAGSGLASMVDACGTSAADHLTHATAPFSKAAADLQMEWWGNSDRASRTYQVINLFQTLNQQYQINGQYHTWGDYWPDLQKRIDGGSAPDILQMDMRYLDQYRQKGYLLDLTNYSPKPIDLKAVDHGLITQASVKGFYTLPIGGNLQALLYNVPLLAEAGITWPVGEYTWSDFAQFLVNLSQKLPKGAWPIEDFSVDITPFEVWIRQYGHELYTPDGGVAFTKQEAAAWFQYWADLRSEGAIVPYDVSHRDYSKLLTNEPIVSRKSAMVMAYSNFPAQYAAVMEDQLQLAGMPRGPKGTTPGTYVKVAMALSVFASSGDPSQSAQFLNYFVNDPAAGRALGLERGAPVNSAVAAAIRSSLTAMDRMTIDFFNSARKNTSAKTVLDPPGAGQFQTNLYNVGTAVLQGQVSISAGADSLVASAHQAVGK